MTGYFLWCDIETQGLDAERHWMFEIAAIVTTVDTLEPVGEPFHRIFQYNDDHIERIKEYTDPFVLEMHEKTGLWDKMVRKEPGWIDGGPTWEDDEDMLAWLQDLVGDEPRQARMAGSSIVLDLNFLRKNLPETAKHLHYRFVDVSGFCYALETQGLITPFDLERDDEHTAMGDILASIAKYKNALAQVKALG